MRKSHIILLALPCLLWACGTTKQAVNNAGQKQETVSTVAKQKEVTGKQNATATSLSFVQKVSDNSVYAQNIVSSMTFSIKAAVDMSSLRWQCDGLGSMAAADSILFRLFS